MEILKHQSFLIIDELIIVYSGAVNDALGSDVDITAGRHLAVPK